MSDRQAKQPLLRCVARSGYAELESAFLDETLGFRASDPWAPLLVVVPSRNVRGRLREALVSRAGGAFSVRFLLFPDLARFVLEEAGERLPTVDDLSALLVLSDVARPLQGNPASPFRTVAGRTGFHESLFESLVELEESGFSPGEAGEGDLPPRLADVLAVHRAWSDALAGRSLSTTAGLLRRAAERAPAAPPGAPVFVYGLYDFTGNQRRLIEGLAARRPLTVFLPVFPADAGPYADAARAWLEELAGPIDGIAPPANRAATAPSVDIFSAPGERREVEEAARRVLALLDQGVPPGDIGVCYRSAEPYARLVTEIFSAAGIAVSGGAGTRLAETRVGRTLRHVMGAARGERDRREVLDLFDLVLADARAHRVAEWDAWTREAGITRGASGWREGLARLTRNPDVSAESLAELREELERLGPLLDGLRAPRRFDAAAGALIEAGRRWFPDDPDWPDAEAALERLADLDRSGVAPSAAAFDWLLARLLGAPRRAPRERRAAVRALDVAEARGLAFRHLVLLGLTERIFPRVVTQDPILLDADRKRLADRVAWLPARRAGVDEERLLFWLARNAAPHLVLSWSRLDPATGRPRIPSSFLLETAAGEGAVTLDIAALERAAHRVPLDPMADSREAARRDPGPPLPGGHPATAALDDTRLTRLLLAAALGAGRLDRVAALLPGADFRRRRDAELARSRPRLTAFDGAIEDPALLDRLALRFGDDHAWSASQLETYAVCPRRFFLERLLGLEELEAPEDVVRVSPLDRGRVLHDILRRFLMDPDTGPLVPERRATLRAALRTLAARHMAEFAATSRVGAPLLWRIDAARGIDDLLDWLDFELARTDARRPARYEVRFGLRPAAGRPEDPASTESGPVLEVGGGETMRFGGYVDRIDLDDAGRSARILDYKSGRPPAGRPKTPLDGGARLQLAIYRLALERLVPGLERGDAAYVYLGGRVAEETLSEEQFAALRPELARVAGILRAGLRAGLVFSRPKEAAGGRCACPFPSICGADRRGLFERKQADGRMAPHLSLDAAAAAAADEDAEEEA